MWLSFWVIPIFSACVWWAMITAMLSNWAVRGHHRIISMDTGQRIPFLSDIGAFGLKPLFITMSIITVVTFTATFLIERWLRHASKLARNTNRRQKWYACISIFFALMGMFGLMFLSIFDTYRHPEVHTGMLVLFIAGYILSAFFFCLEYISLSKGYSWYATFTVSFIIKALFIIIELPLAISFAVASRKNATNAAAVIEWTISYIFGFYMLSFVLDLLPAIKTKSHIPQGYRIRPEMSEMRLESRDQQA